MKLTTKFLDALNSNSLKEKSVAKISWDGRTEGPTKTLTKERIDVDQYTPLFGAGLQIYHKLSDCKFTMCI